MEKLLGFGVLPIVNENDTVSTAELETVNGGRQAAFSDNDRLAALVMSGLEADALVLLTNVDGLFARSPSGTDGRSNNDQISEIIPLVCEVFGDLIFFFQAEDGIRDHCVTGVQTCALPI